MAEKDEWNDSEEEDWDGGWVDSGQKKVIRGNGSIDDKGDGQNQQGDSGWVDEEDIVEEEEGDGGWVEAEDEGRSGGSRALWQRRRQPQQILQQIRHLLHVHSFPHSMPFLLHHLGAPRTGYILCGKLSPFPTWKIIITTKTQPIVTWLQLRAKSMRGGWALQIDQCNTTFVILITHGEEYLQWWGISILAEEWRWQGIQGGIQTGWAEGCYGHIFGGWHDSFIERISVSKFEISLAELRYPFLLWLQNDIE